MHFIFYLIIAQHSRRPTSSNRWIWFLSIIEIHIWNWNTHVLLKMPPNSDARWCENLHFAGAIIREKSSLSPTSTCWPICHYFGNHCFFHTITRQWKWILLVTLCNCVLLNSLLSVSIQTLPCSHCPKMFTDTSQ